MSYTTEDKLQREVEKLIEEVKILKKPFAMQPGLWISFIGLIISLSVNIIQSKDAKRAEELSIIRVEQLKLDEEKFKKTNDSLNERKTSLIKETTQIEKYKIQLDIIISSLNDSISAINVSTKDSLKSNKVSQTLTAINQAQESIDTLKEKIRDVVYYSKNLKLAASKEREAFECFLNEDYDCASSAFVQSETAYNGYHNAYELAKLLLANKVELSKNSRKREEIIAIILKNYSYGIPQDIISQLRKTIK